MEKCNFLSIVISFVRNISLKPKKKKKKDNKFVFGDFKVHPKDWLTYCGRTDKPSKLFSVFYPANFTHRYFVCDAQSLIQSSLKKMTTLETTQSGSLGQAVIL